MADAYHQMHGASHVLDRKQSMHGASHVLDRKQSIGAGMPCNLKGRNHILEGICVCWDLCVLGGGDFMGPFCLRSPFAAANM